MASLEDLQSLKSGVRYTHVQTQHFNSDIKRMSIVYYDLNTGQNQVFMKGAPERVLEACTYYLNREIFMDERRMEVLRWIEQFASEGLVSIIFSNC